MTVIFGLRGVFGDYLCSIPNKNANFLDDSSVFLGAIRID